MASELRVFTFLLLLSCSPPPGSAVVSVGFVYEQPDLTADDFDAAQLAVDDINQSGIFAEQWKVVGAPFVDDSDRAALGRQLIERDGAVAVLGDYSSTMRALLQVTHTDHPEISLCSGSSTSATLNDPATPNLPDGTVAGDRNGTLFRTVGNDTLQAKVLWRLVGGAPRVGLFHLDDTYGQAFERELSRLAGPTGFSFKASFTDRFISSAEQPDIDAILAANRANTLTTLVLITIDQVGPILKALIDAPVPFRGRILISDGGITRGAFESQTAQFGAWLAQPGNAIIGVSPDALNGAQSAPWVARFVETHPLFSAASTTAPTAAADCVYLLAIAALATPRGTRLEPATLRDGLNRFRASQLSDAVNVPPTAEGLRTARDALASGSKVRLDGASGLIEFDETGDRLAQLYTVWQPRGTSSGGGPWLWQSVEVWDSSRGCVRLADGGVCP